MVLNIKLSGVVSGRREEILSDEARHFLQALHYKFEPRRQELLQRRKEISKKLQAGWIPQPNPDTEWMRETQWKVPLPRFDAQDRRVEITGPTDAKMMINALNSGAKVFMADLEDSLSPTWNNVIDGQVNLKDAVDRTLTFTSADQKTYRLNSILATLMVRPRGWHLPEAHVTIDGQAMSASLFDFGLFFFHNAKTLYARGSGPLFYLPKLENHLEARLWNDVFICAQDYMGLPRGTTRATVLIETCLAAFEMEEILFELREHAAGLNAGRWDYLFSMIKKFSHRSDLIFPDRERLTMTLPFMRAYTQTLVDICHKHGAHAIGGMAAFIPSRRDAEVNAKAFAKVREDKIREAADGFDGTWVAHPDLVPVALEVFDLALGTHPSQKHVRPVFRPLFSELLPTADARVTRAGIANNVSVSLQYINSWLKGDGAVAINGLMEDAATAEIARAELWQWAKYGVSTMEGDLINHRFLGDTIDQEAAKLGSLDLKNSSQLLSRLISESDFPDFLTLPAYELLLAKQETI